LAELTKFEIIPAHQTLEQLRRLQDDQSFKSIEVIALILRYCGQYLLKHPDVGVKMQTALDSLIRLKDKDELPAQVAHKLEEGIQVCRPTRPAQGTKVLTPMQLYIQHLFLDRMPKAAHLLATKTEEVVEAGTPRNDIDSVIALILKLNFKQHHDFILRQFILLISTARHTDMEAIAVLLAATKEHHRSLVILIMDHCFEQVTRGIEENDFKDAQRRLSLLKFIGACWDFKVVHTDTLFTLLYALINIDSRTGQPLQKFILKDQDPLDSFRVRLVCCLLNAVQKQAFVVNKKRKLMMDRFLVFFQEYALSKEELLIDAKIELADTLELIRPQKTGVYRKFNTL
jgi:regulator of nonsense transcripts 2